MFRKSEGRGEGVARHNSNSEFVEGRNFWPYSLELEGGLVKLDPGLYFEHEATQIAQGL
jgi:hypothetical protein